MIIIQQGTATPVELSLDEFFSLEELANISAIEVIFGAGKEQVKYHWYSYNISKNTMTYVSNIKKLKITIEANKSAKWKYQIPMQIRIKNRDKTINNSDVYYAYIKQALSLEEF